LAEELLDEALELEEEEARMLEGVDMANEDEGDVDSEKGIDVMNKEVDDEASEQKSGKLDVKSSTDTVTDAATT
jgi:hypothetical protein